MPADIRLILNYTPGQASRGSMVCINMDTTGTTGNGILQGDYITLSDGIKNCTFVFDPGMIVPQVGNTYPVRISYGSLEEAVRDALFSTIASSGLNVMLSKDGSDGLKIDNMSNGTAGNVNITQSFVTGDFSPFGMSGGSANFGNSRFTSMTPQQMSKVIIPVGAIRGEGALMAMDKVRGIGGVSVYVTSAGTVIKGSVFERILYTPGNEVILNLLDMTQGLTADSVILVQAFGRATGATGGDTIVFQTLSPSEILGFTGGYFEAHMP